jgi:hypothetical protein
MQISSTLPESTAAVITPLVSLIRPLLRPTIRVLPPSLLVPSLFSYTENYLVFLFCTVDVFTVDVIKVLLCQLRAITDPKASPMRWLVSDMCVLPLSPIERGGSFVIRDKTDLQRLVFVGYELRSYFSVTAV